MTKRLKIAAVGVIIIISAAFLLNTAVKHHRLSQLPEKEQQLTLYMQKVEKELKKKKFEIKYSLVQNSSGDEIVCTVDISPAYYHISPKRNIIEETAEVFNKYDDYKKYKLISKPGNTLKLRMTDGNTEPFAVVRFEYSGFFYEPREIYSDLNNKSNRYYGKFSDYFAIPGIENTKTLIACIKEPSHAEYCSLISRLEKLESLTLYDTAVNITYFIHLTALRKMSILEVRYSYGYEYMQLMPSLEYARFTYGDPYLSTGLAGLIDTLKGLMPETNLILEAADRVYNERDFKQTANDADMQ